MPEWIQPVILYVVELVLSGFLAWLGATVIKWLKTKTKNDKIIAFAETVKNVTTEAVKATYQTFVQGIKGTESWTPEAQVEALDRAITTAKTSLTSEAKKYIESQHGDINTYLGSLAESILYDLKNKPSETTTTSAQ